MQQHLLCTHASLMLAQGVQSHPANIKTWERGQTERRAGPSFSNLLTLMAFSTGAEGKPLLVLEHQSVHGTLMDSLMPPAHSMVEAVLEALP